MSLYTSTLHVVLSKTFLVVCYIYFVIYNFTSLMNDCDMFVVTRCEAGYMVPFSIQRHHKQEPMNGKHLTIQSILLSKSGSSRICNILRCSSRICSMLRNFQHVRNATRTSFRKKHAFNCQMYIFTIFYIVHCSLFMYIPIEYKYLQY